MITLKNEYCINLLLNKQQEITLAQLAFAQIILKAG